jgi:hypothetical protein
LCIYTADEEAKPSALLSPKEIRVIGLLESHSGPQPVTR